jgi:cytochrome c553
MFGVQTMKKLVLIRLLSFLGLFMAITTSAMAGDAEAGKNKSAACGGCHGFDGNSAIPMYPKLAGQNEAYIVKQIHAFKANDKRQNAIMMGMAAGLSDEDAADIGAYFQAQSVKAAATFDESKIAAGRDLYKGGDLQNGVPACQGCHGPTGAGIAGIGYPQLGGQYVDYTLAQLKAFKEGSRSNDEKAVMRSIVAQLSEDDMVALANYIASLK